LIDQPRTLDRSRIGDGPLTRLTEREMAAVETTLKAVLGLAE
jgi:mRNA interferase MazF